MNKQRRVFKKTYALLQIERNIVFRSFDSGNSGKKSTEKGGTLTCRLIKSTILLSADLPTYPLRMNAPFT